MRRIFTLEELDALELPPVYLESVDQICRELVDAARFYFTHPKDKLSFLTVFGDFQLIQESGMIDHYTYLMTRLMERICREEVSSYYFMIDCIVLVGLSFDPRFFWCLDNGGNSLEADSESDCVPHGVLLPLPSPQSRNLRSQTPESGQQGLQWLRGSFRCPQIHDSQRIQRISIVSKLTTVL